MTVLMLRPVYSIIVGTHYIRKVSYICYHSLGTDKPVSWRFAMLNLQCPTRALLLQGERVFQLLLSWMLVPPPYWRYQGPQGAYQEFKKQYNIFSCCSSQFFPPKVATSYEIGEASSSNRRLFGERIVIFAWVVVKFY